MDKQAYERLMAEKFTELEKLDEIGDFYTYEKRFAEIMKDMNRKMMEMSLGKPKADRRKKKVVATTYGSVAVPHSRGFKSGLGPFRISPLCQEKILLAGTAMPYDEASRVLEELTGIKASDTSIFRICEHYGNIADSELSFPDEALEVSDEPVYAQVDGSMILTDHEWKEVKLGRVFAGDRLEESQYCGYLGRFCAPNECAY